MNRARGTALRLFVSLSFLGLALPSRSVHGDAFDELAGYELPDLILKYKHPATDAALWSLWHLLHALGFHGRALVPTQIWNAFFTALALTGVFVYGVRVTRSEKLALGAALLLAASHVGLHWLRDPFLPYWPTSLALVSWMLVVAGPAHAPPPVARRRLRLALVAGLGAVACTFNPMAMLPVVAVSATIALAEGERGLEVHPLSAAIGLGWFACAPALLLVLALWPSDARDPGAGIYGHFRPHELELAFAGLRDALIAPVFDETRAWLGSIAFALLLGLAGLALFAARRTSPARRPLALPFWLAALGTALFVSWWDVQQPHFWLLLPWLVVLGWLTQNGETAVSPGFSRLASSAIASLALVNTLGYVLPTAGGADPAQRFSERAKQVFRAQDLLVFPVWPDASLQYYAGLGSTGWLALQSSRRQGERTFDAFVQADAWVRARGGSLWVAVSDGGRPDVPKDLEELGTDLGRRDLDRISLGLTEEIAGSRFRRVEAISPFPPCRSRGRSTPLASGRSFVSGDFAESARSRDYAPERAFDGSMSSEWLSAEAHPFVELYTDPPRALEGIRLINARNSPWNDFGTARAELTLWDGEVRVLESQLVFAPGADEQRLTRRVARFDCLRVLVLEHTGRGGGFAEIQPF